MDLRVVGCHGGESPKHRTSGFVLSAGRARIAIDGGSLTTGLTLAEQCALGAVIVSHGHMDHLKDLATLADNRCQGEAPPLVLAGTRQTIGILKRHFFNGLLWPDFAEIPSARRPTIVYQVLKPEKPAVVAGFEVRAIEVSHTIDSCGFILRADGRRDEGAFAYSGDTGPTDRLWRALDETDDLRALLAEVSFPNAQQKLATVSGHQTPRTLERDLRKMKRHPGLATFLYHIKPTFEREVEREVAKLKAGVDLNLLRIGDELAL